MIEKKPFQDANGEWWIYRSDDDRPSPVPLGPFFTAGYAKEIERSARARLSTVKRSAILADPTATVAPLPAQLSHPLPVMPYRTPA